MKKAALLLAPAAAAADAAIENELVIITPVGKNLTDPALAQFGRQAKERWNVEVRTSAIAAGTPIAYGRILEWNGRPQADLFWGGESARSPIPAPCSSPPASSTTRACYSVYDDRLAQGRYEQVNATFRKEIEARWAELKRRPAR